MIPLYPHAPRILKYLLLFQVNAFLTASGDCLIGPPTDFGPVATTVDDDDDDQRNDEQPSL